MIPIRHQTRRLPPGSPCGNLTKDVFDRAGIDLNPVSEEQKVTDVRGKIESGEGDAGLVTALTPLPPVTKSKSFQ